MMSKQFHWIPYSIIATIVVTIAVQLYWNSNNYKINKQRVTNDIQISLDNALEEYYAALAKTDFLTIVKSDFETASWTNQPRDSIEISSVSIETNEALDSDSILQNVKKELNLQLQLDHKKPIDSIAGFTQLLKDGKGYTIEQGKKLQDVQVIQGKKAFDSLKILKHKLGTILISMERDNLEYQKIDSLLALQFKRKDITVAHSLMHYKRDSLVYASNTDLDAKSALSVASNSTYIKPSENITLRFQNPLKDALKLSISGILISLLLSAAIIACLLYLLYIIKHQKQLSEVKNDLISNITHEFKTPIATIGVALESLQNFDAIKDKDKTKTYLDMSNTQLSKLNTMVEKLLETATLDSEDIELKKDRYNISELVTSITKKHQLQHEKLVHLELDDSVFAKVDFFHFENAINNIIDNAFKYGGQKIEVRLKALSDKIEIAISDDGNSLSKVHKDRIFEKFYRVPKGNTHDVKGFGIGLYYTKKIIEKHNGSIDLNLSPSKTTFKITMPYA